MSKFLITVSISLFFAACVAGTEYSEKIGGVIDSSSYSDLQYMAQGGFGAAGAYKTQDFDVTKFLTTWNFNNLPLEEREKFYKETPLPDGTLFREYWFNVKNVQIEVAPGVFYPAWAYNGQVPGPTIRATEGDTLKIHFLNQGDKPHTMHFHGFHSDKMDGSAQEDFVLAGEEFVYEFKAEPFGLHLYHCHSFPLSQHISKGLYGVYIIDPKLDERPKADKELIMVMNGFDVNFDGANEIYAVNSRAFAYANEPIKVKKGELVRIYLGNMLEFDLINSFHLHANFFDVYPTGTKMDPTDFTDIVMMGQGERSMLDVRFKETGMYMFHAHVTEFSELGWMGMFEVTD